MKVSIITVTFNSGKTLQATIDSVFIQNHSDIEYIVIDGASLDNTLDVIKNNFPRVINKYISEPDNGLYDAINKGIKISTGDIVGIINSDDFYVSCDAISSVVSAFICNSEIEAVYSDVHFVKNSNLNKTVRYYSSKKFKPYLFRFGFMPAHPTFFVKRFYFDLFGFYKTNYLIAADFELMIRFFYINRIRYKYLNVNLIRMRLGGISTNSWRSNLILNKEIIRACKENGIYTNFFILSLKYFIKVFELIKTR